MPAPSRQCPVSLLRSDILKVIHAFYLQSNLHTHLTLLYKGENRHHPVAAGSPETGSYVNSLARDSCCRRRCLMRVLQCCRAWLWVCAWPAESPPPLSSAPLYACPPPGAEEEGPLRASVVVSRSLRTDWGPWREDREEGVSTKSPRVSTAYSPVLRILSSPLNWSFSNQ